MTTRFNFRWLSLSVLLFSLQFCRAQTNVIPPTLNFALGTTDLPQSQLWDLNGTYAADVLVQGRSAAIPMEISFTLLQSPSGQLSTTTNDFSNCSVVFNNDDQSVFACVAKISGKVTGFAGLARAHFTISFVGNGFLAGRSTTIRGTYTVDAEPDTSGQLSGSSKFSATFNGLPAIKGTADFATALPPGIDGSWNLTLKIVGVNRLAGSGVVTTPSEALGLDLSGKFKNGLISIKAKGAGDVPNTVNGKSASATIQLDSDGNLNLFNGKLLGQRPVF